MELDKNSRNALDRLTQVTREADGVMDWNSHSVVLSYHKQQLSFDYSPDTQLLTMTDTNNVKSTLLDNCTFLDFQIFQRNSVGGSYDQYPVTLNESAAKIVQVSWICPSKPKFLTEFSVTGYFSISSKQKGNLLSRNSVIY